MPAPTDKSPYGVPVALPGGSELLPTTELPGLPRLTITRETYGEVRSVPSAGNCQVIVRANLTAGSGGVQTEIPAEHINRADRLAPTSRVYCFEGVEERDGRMQRVAVFYAMGSAETFDEARAAMTAGCEVTGG